MTGLLTLPIVAFVKATSSAVELRPYCAAMHSYPSACRGTINLLKHEPSAQSPWQKTILGLVCVAFILFSSFSFVASFHGFALAASIPGCKANSEVLQCPSPHMH